MSRKNFFIIYLITLLLIINISIINNQNVSSENIDDEKKGQKSEENNLLEEFTNEWIEKMNDYKMEYLYYIPLEQGEQEDYFENITTVPTLFKGAFFLSDESGNKIEFYVRDSFDQIIYQATGHFNIFEIPINKTDKYSITFRNNMAKNKVVVTFTVNTGQNNLINSTDLSNTEKKMDNLEAVIKKFNMEFKLTRDIHTRRYKSKL